MLLPSNFLFLSSLGLTSWLILVYLKQIEQTHTPEVKFETNAAHGSDIGSSCGIYNAAVTSRFLNFEFFLQFFFIFMCLFVMAKVAEYTETSIWKFFRNPEKIVVPPIGAGPEVTGDQLLEIKNEELSCCSTRAYVRNADNGNGEPMAYLCSRMREEALLTHLQLLQKQNMHLEQELQEILRIGHKFETLMERSGSQTPFQQNTVSFSMPCTRAMETQTMLHNELQIPFPLNVHMQRSPYPALTIPSTIEPPLTTYGLNQEQTLKTQASIEKLNPTYPISPSPQVESNGSFIPQILRLLWAPKRPLRLTLAPENQQRSSSPTQGLDKISLYSKSQASTKSAQGCKNITQNAILPATEKTTQDCEKISQPAKSQSTAKPTQCCEHITQPAKSPATAKPTEGYEKLSQSVKRQSTAKVTQDGENITQPAKSQSTAKLAQLSENITQHAKSQSTAKPAQGCEHITLPDKSLATAKPTENCETLSQLVKQTPAPTKRAMDKLKPRMVSRASQTIMQARLPAPTKPSVKASKMFVEGHTQTTPHNTTRNKCSEHRTSFLFHRKVVDASPDCVSTPKLWESYLDLQEEGTPPDYKSLLPNPSRYATKADIETLESGAPPSGSKPMVITTEDLLKLKHNFI